MTRENNNNNSKPVSAGVDEYKRGERGNASHQGGPTLKFQRMVVDNQPIRIHSPLQREGIAKPDLELGKSQLNEKWIFEKDNLGQVPEFLERTHVNVKNTNPSLILDRIRSCLYEMSIHAKFVLDKVRIECETENFVKFNINMYRMENDEVIVEVQRRKGCCMQYGCVCKTILKTAEGKSNESNINTKAFNCSKMGGVQCEQDLKTEVVKTLENSLELLESECREADEMVLSDLSCITDVTKTCPKAAHIASKAIFLDSKDTLLSLCLNAMKGDFASDENTDAREEIRTCCRLGLMTLFNCMSNLVHDSKLLEKVLMQHEEMFMNEVIPTLVKHVSCAKKCPHTACLAARCIHLFLENSFDYFQLIKNNQESFEEAAIIGIRSHKHLENAIKSLRSSFEN